MNLDQFFLSWLIGFLFCLSLSLGSLALLMLQHLSGGQWGMVGRRVFEAGSRMLPIVALLFVPLLFGMPKLFLWAQPEAVAGSHVIQMKAAYLNVTFFVVRAVVYFAVLDAAACVLLNRWSAEQDRGEARHQGRLDPLPHGQRARACCSSSSPSPSPRSTGSCRSSPNGSRRSSGC